MKKTIALLLAVSMIGTMMTGCANSKEETKETEENTVASEKNFSEIDLEKYVTKLGEYKGLALTTTPTNEIDEAAVNLYIEKMLDNNKQQKEITNRPVQKDDVVNINYVGKKDGVAFEGGTADNYDLQIGSGSFIEGFEDGLIGAEKGDVVDLELTFPEEYHAEDLAGQPVVFTVTVNKISELVPAELNEEFVASLEIENVKTIDEFKAFVKENMIEAAAEAKKNELMTQVMNLLMEESEFVENPPEQLYNYYKGVLEQSFVQTAQSAGMELMDFVTNIYGMSEEEFHAQLEDAAKNSTNQAMVCALIAKKEGLTVTDEELEQNINEHYKEFGFESADAYKEAGLSEDYRDYLTTNKALDFIIENAVITEKEVVEEESSEEVTEVTTEATTEANTEGSTETE